MLIASGPLCQRNGRTGYEHFMIGLAVVNANRPLAGHLHCATQESRHVQTLAQSVKLLDRGVN